jgi:hypothetical protein
MLPILQLGLLIVILFLVIHSHMRASYAAEQLSQFKEGETLMLLQLQKIERHSLQLHENISKRLRKAGITDSSSEDDPDPLSRQKTELYSMTKELDVQTEELQAQFQSNAVDHIVQEYGEGPVKVILEIDFPEDHGGSNYYSSSSSSSYQHKSLISDGSTHLSIVLWPDTPYAAWAWLEQIERHVWDGAILNWSLNQPILEVTPAKPDPLGRGHLDFVETAHNSNLHGVWTVGLRENERGKLQMFLNLQDNGEYHQHEACVGKVMDGFEALQRIVSTTRENKDVSTIRIKKAQAVHVTKRELGILYE